ncbi:hypothetical protein caldi_11430 [Caldinitratiruptor microaerophilus]|uniref:Uncharacterized protein n=1 Tax=Caldinitratiruptor microaerophilus TaxID=671077 RepID=A0AA35CKF5_9FIRM|nr:hypothetical protein caldi_11430 [Caldinitratiruptor microaerophilus]
MVIAPPTRLAATRHGAGCPAGYRGAPAVTLPVPMAVAVHGAVLAVRPLVHTPDIHTPDLTLARLRSYTETIYFEI